MLKDNKENLIKRFLTKYCVENAEMNVKKWWNLAEFLITKYNDGYIKDKTGRVHEVGYPEEWLKKEVENNPEKYRLKEQRDGKGEL